MSRELRLRRERGTSSRAHTDFPAPAELLALERSLLSTRSLEALLQRAARASATVAEADLVLVHEYLPDARALAFPPGVHGRVKRPDSIPRSAEGSRDKTLDLVRLVESGRCRYVCDARADSRLTGRAVTTLTDVNVEAIASYAVLPLTLFDRCIGVLILHYRKPQEFARARRTVFEMLAGHIALAVHRARLARSLDEHERHSGALQLIAEAVTPTAGHRQVAHTVLSAFRQVVPYKKATLQLIQGDNRTLIACRGFRLPAADPWLLRPLSNDALVAQVIASKKPLILADPGSYPLWESRPQTIDVRSWVGLPLVCGGETVALITVDHDRAGVYQPALEPNLLSFATHAALAIKTAMLFEASRRRVRDLKILTDASQTMSTKLETDGLLQAIVSNIAKTLRCSHCTLFFPELRDGAMFLVPRKTHGKRASLILERAFRADEGLVGDVYSHGHSYALPDARAHPRFAPARENRDQPRSMLVVPVKVGDQILAVISADRDDYGWFREVELRLVEALATQAGIAIQRQQGLELLQNIANRINTAEELGTLLEAIIEGAIRLTHTDAGVIYLVDETNPRITDTRKYPPDSFHPQPRMDRPDGVTRQVMRTRRAVTFKDLRRHARVNLELQHHYRSMIAVPLIQGKSVQGVLYLNDRTQHDFTETEKSLLRTLANQAATALNKARLLADRESQVTRHKKLNEVGAVLTGILDEQQILDEVARVAADTLNCTHCTVFRIEGASMVVRAAKGALAPFMPTGRAFARNHGVAGWVAHTKRPRLVPDASREPRFDPTWTTPPPASVLAVPILLDAKVYGVISAEHERRDAFRHADQRLLETLALQVAQAVRVARRIHDLETLNRTGRAIGGELDVAYLLRATLDNVNELLACRTALAFTVEPGSIPALRESVGRPTPAVLAAGRQLARRVVLDAAAATTVVARVTHLLAAPMLRSGRVTGVLCAARRGDPFDDAERRLLDTFATQAAASYESASLYGQTKRQAEQLSVLHKISSEWMAVDLDTLLRLIINGATQLTRTDHGIIYLLTEDGVRIRNFVSAPYNHLPARMELNTGGLTRWIFENGKTVAVEDAASDSRTSPEIAEVGIRSYVGHPLKIGTRVLGVLYLNARERRSFSESELALIDTLASQAAIAIDSAELFQQQKKDSAALRRIVAIVGTIGLGADPLPVILAEAIKLFPIIDYASFALVDDGAGTLGLCAVWDKNELLVADDIAADTKFRNWEEGINGHVARTGRAYRTGDVAHDPLHKPRRATVSEMVVPLKLDGDRVIGVLDLESSRRDAFTQADQALCEDVCRIAAIALEKGRLFRAMQQLERQLQGLGWAIEEDSVEELLDRTLARVNEVLGDHGSSSVALIDDEHSDFYGTRAAGPLADYLRQSLPRDRGTARHVVATRQPLYLHDVESAGGQPTIREESRARGVRSYAAIPLKRPGKVLGVLFINVQRPFRFTPEVTSVLELLAGQAAIAIQNARLHEEQQRRAQERSQAIRSRFNPYTTGAPIGRPEDFFGREQLIQSILNGIHRNSFMVTGERRIGKTSLLHQLRMRLENLDDREYHFLPVFVSLEGITEQDFWSVLIRILRVNYSCRCATTISAGPSHGRHLPAATTRRVGKGAGVASREGPVVPRYWGADGTEGGLAQRVPPKWRRLPNTGRALRGGMARDRGGAGHRPTRSRDRRLWTA